jgi:type II secretory ATPase GspE/PulE/Tfp pilus assembly ATPase PilB-like protein
MVGEIRDQETASIAVNAALTGHKMFSTLHTNDAATTLPRLLDMKVEPFLIASTINIAIGQRLLRMICPSCKVKRRLTDLEFQGLKEVMPITILKQHREFYKGQGCKSCNGSGYKSRVGIYEIMEIDDDIREAIVRRADAGELKKIAIKKGMKTMMEDAFQKALDGVTTIEEVLKMTHED